MSLAYAHEKFSNAIRALALGRGEIKERLTDAFVSHLGYIREERDIPEDLREEFTQLKQRVTREHPTAASLGEGWLQATINTMTQEEAVEIATEIWTLAYRIEGMLEDERTQ